MNLFLSCSVIVAVATEPVSITVHRNQTVEPLRTTWAWFGYDEPNYTYMKDGKRLLSQLSQASPVPIYVRAHNLMTSGDGTPALKWGSTNIYTEDANGNPIYDFHIVDSIFDTYVERGMKPLVQLGFMPEALSTNPNPYQHKWRPGVAYKEIITGWAYPPKSYERWEELVYRWVNHCVERYGKAEVESWYWELWNEPDGDYWKATMDEFFKLYDYSAHAVKRALPTARFGGPHTAWDPKWVRGFLDHCTEGTNYVTGEKGSPLDYISFHAKGSPRFTDGHVRMNIGHHLRVVHNNFAIINSYPSLRHLPVVIGENDPEGCAACGMATNPENAYRNGTMYSSYTAALLPRIDDMARARGINLIGAVNWSFEFEDQPWFYGFRDLATNGVGKPILNLFRMMGKMRGERVEVSGNMLYDFETMRKLSVRGDSVDINALASVDGEATYVLLWYYHDEDVPGESKQVEVTLDGVNSTSLFVNHYQIDKEYSNSYEAWKQMGSPQNPTKSQIRQLEKASELAKIARPKRVKSKDGKVCYVFDLPKQGVALLEIK